MDGRETRQRGKGRGMMFPSDDFDPMTEDYNNPDFNSYIVGPGAHIRPSMHTESRRREENQNYKLHVGNVPFDLDEKGLGNLFRPYGDPQRIFLGAGKKDSKNQWGFVEYKTVSEAQQAITYLNKTKPYFLNVKFAISESEKAERKKQAVAHTTFHDVRVKKTGGGGCGRGLIPPMRGVPPKNLMSVPLNLLTPTNSNSSRFSDSDTPEIGYSRERFQHYKKDPYNDSAVEVLGNLTMKVTDNKRKVSLGRGSYIKDDRSDDLRAFSHPFYRPNLDRNVTGLINKAIHYTKKSNGIYSYNVEPPTNLPRDHICKYCKIPTQLACSYCKAWYCSLPCLSKDWDRHKDTCSFTLEKGKPSVENGLIEEEDKEDKSQNVDLFSKSKESHNDNSKPQDSNVQNRPTNQKEGHKNNNKNRRSNKGKNIFIQRGPPEKQNSEKAIVSGNQNPPIPSNIFTKVEIMVAERPNVYWVQNINNASKQAEIVQKLKNHRNKNTKRFNPVVGGMCAAPYLNEWYRAKVLEITPMLKVLFVDFGNVEICNQDELRELPPDLFNVHPLAFRIRLADGTSSKNIGLNNSTTISIKPMLKEDSDTWLVHVEGEKYPVNNSAESPISFDSFMEVTIMYPSNSSDYWVIRAENFKECVKMSESLGDCSAVRIRPTLGGTYVGDFGGVWCRAKVISTNPLKVFYVDYGNEEVKEENSLHPVPAKYKDVPPMAFCIRLAEGTPPQYFGLTEFHSLRVKAVDKLDDGTFIVHVEGNTYPSMPAVSEQANKQLSGGSLPGVHHVLFCIEKGKDVKLDVVKMVSDEQLTGMLIPISTTYRSSYLSNQGISLELSSLKFFPHRAELSDKVCVEHENTKKRGYVMSIWENEYSVALVDYGDVMITPNVIPLPKNLQTIPEAGVRCILETPMLQGSKLKGETLMCKYISCEKDTLNVDISGLGRAKIIPWQPLPEEAKLPVVKIDSGSKVNLSAYKSPQALYVQSLKKDYQELLATLLQDVATHCATAKPLERSPLMGELLACKFSLDENYYRAQVCAKVSDKYEVTFVDYGNTEIVPVTAFKNLSYSLKQEPCCAVKVGLKDVPPTGFSIEAMEFLNGLSSIEEELIIEFENNDFSAVTLAATKQGLTINDHLKQLAIPRWKKALADGKDPSEGHVFVLSDLKYVQWQEKSKISIMILGGRDHYKKLAANTTFEYLTHIYSVLSDQMNEYAEKSVDDRYCPRVDELCIAKYDLDGKWYRAVCTKSLARSCEVVFIDYGNTGEVPYLNIRRILPDFVSSPAMLKCCRIYGIPEKVSDKVEVELGKVLCDGSTHQVVVVEDTNSGAVIWIPSLDSLLDKLGLPKLKPPFDF